MPHTPDINSVPPTPGAKYRAELMTSLAATFSISTSSSNLSKKEKSTIKSRKEKLLSKSAEVKAKKEAKKKSTTPAIGFAGLDLLATSALQQSNGYNSISASTQAVVQKLSEVSTATDELIDKLKLSPTSSDGGSSQASQASQVALEHCYSLPPEADVSAQNQAVSSNGETNAKKQQYLTHDHGGYATPPQRSFSGGASETPPQVNLIHTSNQQVTTSTKPGPGRPRKDSCRISKNKKEDTAIERYNDKANGSKYQTLDSKAVVPQTLANFIPMQMFKPRENSEELRVLYEFLTRGIDAEDIQYVRRTYEMHLQEDTYG